MVGYFKGIRGRALMVKHYFYGRTLDYYTLLSPVTRDLTQKILILNSFKTTYIILDVFFFFFRE